MRYALITNKKIENIIDLDEHALKDFPNAVFCEHYPVQIGDSYENEKFYRDGVEILTYTEQYENDLRTLAERSKQIDSLQTQIEEMQKIKEKIVAANNEQLQLLEDCIVEMAGVVYAADEPAEEHQQ